MGSGICRHIWKWEIVNPDDPDQDNGTKLLNYCSVINPGQVWRPLENYSGNMLLNPVFRAVFLKLWGAPPWVAASAATQLHRIRLDKLQERNVRNQIMANVNNIKKANMHFIYYTANEIPFKKHADIVSISHMNRYSIRKYFSGCFCSCTKPNLFLFLRFDAGHPKIGRTSDVEDIWETVVDELIRSIRVVGCSPGVPQPTNWWLLKGEMFCSVPFFTDARH
ncbi:hypothetical protein TNCV_2999551 [Trichonephila clavipes]|nr:hypothetical protein TNCV_2999551 [Trichonephila clavipes]